MDSLSLARLGALGGRASFQPADTVDVGDDPWTFAGADGQGCYIEYRIILE